MSADPQALYKRALNYALRLLSAREYSRYELITKLLQKYPQDLAHQALAYCDEYGYVSDERCAQMLINHMYSAHYGPMRLNLEAAKRKIPTSIIEPLVAKVDWLKIALELLYKKYAQIPSDLKERQKFWLFYIVAVLVLIFVIKLWIILIKSSFKRFLCLASRQFGA